MANSHFLKCHRWPKITGWKPTADRQSRAFYLEKLLNNGELAVLKWKKELEWIFELLGPMYLRPVSQNSGDSQAIKMLQPNSLTLPTGKLKPKWITFSLQNIFATLYSCGPRDKEPPWNPDPVVVRLYSFISPRRSFRRQLRSLRNF